MDFRVGEAEWGVLGIGEVLERRGRCWVTGVGRWVKGEWAWESVGL